jgi:hypothetical protein
MILWQYCTYVHECALMFAFCRQMRLRTTCRRFMQDNHDDGHHGNLLVDEELLHPLDAFQVKMVGGLIQQEKIGPAIIHIQHIVGAVTLVKSLSTQQCLL